MPNHRSILPYSPAPDPRGYAIAPIVFGLLDLVFPGLPARTSNVEQSSVIYKKTGGGRIKSLLMISTIIKGGLKVICFE